MHAGLLLLLFVVLLFCCRPRGAYGLIMLRRAASLFMFVTSEAPGAATELSLGPPGSKFRVEADAPSPDPYFVLNSVFLQKQ